MTGGRLIDNLPQVTLLIALQTANWYAVFR
jgi:hypothetical protein